MKNEKRNPPNYRSFHHPQIKSSVCKTLVNRAYSVCDKESVNKELAHLNVVLQQNGFPIDKISLTPPPPRSDKKQEFSDSVCIPYVGPASHQIECILASSSIKVYHCSRQKIYQLLYSHKDKTDSNLKPGVYRIHWGNRSQFETETKRTQRLQYQMPSKQISLSKTRVGT